MDPTLQFLCYLGALICFVAVALGIQVAWPEKARVGLLGLGLGLWVLVPLVDAAKAM